MNVEEKDCSDLSSSQTLNLDCQRDIRQKSLNELIKEKYMGPIMKN